MALPSGIFFIIRSILMPSSRVVYKNLLPLNPIRRTIIDSYTIANAARNYFRRDFLIKSCLKINFC